MAADARWMFAVAWGFLVVTALLGVVLRLQAVRPIADVDYGNWLHAHSHTAFLGWVFNAFFALAAAWWLGPERRRFFLRLFWILQVANLGMLASFPVQGYGAVSIVFSTLHVGGGLAFAVALWRHPAVAGAARPWLRLALVAMLHSGLGPLALGPLAALDLRAHPAYTLSIYWYLHFQYNGWFLLFPLALAVDGAVRRGWHRPGLTVAAWLLGAGIGLTFLISVMWLEPPLWVPALAGVGGVLQLAGAALAAVALRAAWRGFAEGAGSVPRLLLTVAVSAFFIKAGVQLVSVWPALAALVNHRFLVIAFLHWVFLAVSLPQLLAVAWRQGWIRDGWWTRVGLILLAAGVAAGTAVLVYPVLAGSGWPVMVRIGELLLVAAVVKLAGIVLIAPRWR